MEMIGIAIVSALPLVMIALVLAVALAKTPLSRPSHIKRILCAWAAIGVAVLAGNYLYYHVGEASAVAVAMFSTFASIILQFHWSARRFLDLGWPRWLFLVCVTGVGAIGVTIMPMIFATRSGNTQEESTKPDETT